MNTLEFKETNKKNDARQNMTNTPRRHIYCLAYPEYNFVWSYFLKGEIFCLFKIVKLSQPFIYYINDIFVHLKILIVHNVSYDCVAFRFTNFLFYQFCTTVKWITFVLVVCRNR